MLVRPLLLAASLLVAPTHGAATVQASPEPSAWRVVAFGAEEGLAPGRVAQVLLAGDGRIWASTQRGPAWFDGYGWVGIAPGAGLPDGPTALLVGIPGSPRVLAIVPGGIFVGDTAGFAPALDRPHNSPVRGVVASGPDSVLVLDGTGALSLIVGRTLAPADFGVSGPVLGVWAPRRGVVWLATATGLFRWEGGRSALRMPFSAQVPEVTRLVEGEDGSGLVVVSSPITQRGVWGWDRGGTPRRIEDDLGLETVRDIAVGAGVSVLVHHFGQVSVGSRRAGFGDLDRSRIGRALSVAVEPGGDTWLGTERGVTLLRRSAGPWSRLPTGSTRLGRRVQEMARGPDGSLWVATAQGLERHFPDGRVERLDEAAGIRIADVTGLALDASGAPWISSGSSFDGAVRWDGTARAWVHVGPAQGLLNVRVHRIRRDRQGRIWLLGLAPSGPAGPLHPEPGVFVVEPGDSVPRRWPSAGDTTFRGHRMYAMAEAPDGSRWFATDKGIVAERNGAFRRWTTEERLLGPRVFDLDVGPDGRVWFTHQTDRALSGQGTALGYVDPEGRVGYVELPSPLAGTTVWEIAAGRDGRVWAAGDGGVAVLDPVTGSWSALGEAEGMGDTWVWPILPEDGRVLFGTADGVQVLDLVAAGRVPPPRVVVAPPATGPDSVHLGWAVLVWDGGGAPERIEVRHRFDGGPWSAWGVASAASWPRSRPGGRHTLEVQAKGLLGEPGEPVRVEFTAHRLPLRNPWVVGLAALLALSGLGWAGSSWRAGRREVRLIREAHDEYRDLFRGAPDLYLRVGLATGAILEASDAALAVLGRGPDDLVGRSFHEIFANRDRLAVTAFLAAMAEHGRAAAVELSVRRGDGAAAPVEISGALTRGAGPGEETVRLLLRDITPRREAEQIRRLYHLTLEHSPDPLVWLDRRGVIEYANRAAGTITATPPDALVGHDLTEIVPEGAARLRAEWGVLGEGAPLRFDTFILRKDGGENVPVEFVASAVSGGGQELVAVHLRDLTERNARDAEGLRFRRELEQATRFRALARLTGGIAHEFNNLLAGIMGYAELILDATVPTEAARAYGEAIIDAAQRGGDLSRQMLVFGGVGGGVEGTFEVSHHLERSLLQLKELMPVGGGLIADLQASGEARGDASLLFKAVWEIVKNAAEALPAAGGSVRLTTRDLTFLEETPGGAVTIPPGSYVEIAVEDDGPGIPGEVLDRLAEPFWTTKASSGHPGLGLAVAQGVVASYHGILEVASAGDRGARVRMLIPSNVETDSQPMPPSETLHVLVVDDQPQVCEVTALHLESRGHTVTRAPSGEVALERFLADPQGFDLVVTDYSMPGMNGVELVTAVRAARPDLPVIIMSGYSEEMERLQREWAAGVRFIAKPFRKADLMEAVAGVTAV